MAVQPDLPGIEVIVCVDDIPLKEFEDDEEERQLGSGGPTKKVSKYIESVADQEFTVKYFVRHPFKLDSPMLGGDVLVDGKRVAQKVLSKKTYDGDFEQIVDGVEDKDEQSGRMVFRSFRFSKVETSRSWPVIRLPSSNLLVIKALDDDAYARVEKDTKRMADVGSISIQIWRVAEGRKVASVPKKVAELSKTEVHEKALKGEPKYHGIS